ncbi:MAG: hypothetical protein D3916_17950 [Candidatus Electrothrix sp. MAN1_4]|nr:hypothetical protein [Candidatus Electrothrix sp. MAN1_4]
MADCWVQITSGRGPEECCRAAFHLVRAFSEQAAKKDIMVDCLEITQGDQPKTVRSALLSLREHSQKVGQITLAALSEKICSLSMFQRPAL